jgi:hypothetical protein|tara:strand:- start:303 stop:551 length:249 start_codon:yes stop_codon:yes gene_type:complete
MDKYTKLILTVIAVGLMGINFHLFKDEIISPAHADSNHYHYAYQIYDLESHSHSFNSYDYNFSRGVKRIVEKCDVSGSYIDC